ncbi:MAG: rod shape-determining protein [Bacilli bacterium]|jgi:rod shape-determining protein MreB|nr:rod shape-determining protein [Bacilli bacterium]
MKKRIVGLDLGTSNTLIWLKSSDTVVFNEPTVLAWSKKNKKVFEIGYLAHKLIGKVPEDLEIITPIQNGTVADIDAAYAYLERAFGNLHVQKEIKGSRLIMAIPSKITNVEKRAAAEVAMRLGVKELHFIDAAKAAAVGSGIDVFSTRGNMIVDIGGARSNIAALAMGQIVVEKSTMYAGDAADEAVSRYVRTKHHLLIGPKTAEYIKMKIGTLLDSADNNLLEVSGKDLITGLPHSVVCSTSEISQIIIKIYTEIANCIVDTLEIAPAEVSSDIIHTGITLSGGGCLLNGTREFFQKQLSVPVHISPYPLESTIQGIKASAETVLKEDPIFD